MSGVVTTDTTIYALRALPRVLAVGPSRWPAVSSLGPDWWTGAGAGTVPVRDRVLRPTNLRTATG